jgi:hypothetical protein
VWSWLVLHQLANENPESPLCAGRDNSIAEESQGIGAVCGRNHPLTNLGQFLITEAGHIGSTQPTGTPIKQQTHAWFSLPVALASTSTFSCLY